MSLRVDVCNLAARVARIEEKVGIISAKPKADQPADLPDGPKPAKKASKKASKKTAAKK